MSLPCCSHLAGVSSDSSRSYCERHHTYSDDWEAALVPCRVNVVKEIGLQDALKLCFRARKNKKVGAFEVAIQSLISYATGKVSLVD